MKKWYWAALALAGFLMMLPIGPLQLALLLFVPGFAMLAALKRRFDAVEAAAYSFTLSIMAFPLAALVAWLAGVPHATATLLGLLVLAIAAYNRNREAELVNARLQWPVLGVALFIFALVLFITLKTFTLTPEGLVCSTTHASDLNFFLSTAQRYIASPHMPLEDPYLPGYNIVYNWFMQLLMGELGLLTGVDLFVILKILIPLVSALIFLDAYLLALFLFKSERDALAASSLYVAASGLSWAYIAYQVFILKNPAPDIFKELVYDWPGIMSLKYDPTALFFFLPQTQTFGLLGMTFGFLTFLAAIREKSWAYSAVAALALASLVFFHMITAFPVLLAMGLMFLYLIFRRKGDEVVVTALPMAAAAIASLYQLSMLQQGNASQVVLSHNPDVPLTILASIGLLVPFAIYGMYLTRDDEASRLLILFAALNFILLNVVELPATVNTYRFLVYMALPVSLFAGLALSRWLASRNLIKTCVAAAVIVLMVPSTAILVGYYNSSSYVHASSAEYDALAWLKESTPKDAIIYEEPGFFPRVPVVTGRDVAYSGEIYTLQYHNVDHQSDAYAIMGITDPEELYSRLSQYRVSYVLVGDRESQHPFTSALQDERYFRLAYDKDGVRIYEVAGAATQEETHNMEISPLDWLAFFAALLYLLILPGYNITRTLGWDSRLTIVERLVVAFGISVAILTVVSTLLALPFSIGLNFYTLMVPITLIIFLTTKEVVQFIKKALKA
ncbi:DUF2298 domain-containing protein [Methanocella conradii]|uniref:DUF2298 domain-containing protein n=1 Tax=Methanocella conradii TaxID=1175444 RepID=UPI0024B36A84|nr:DUF2298 domain-containing protein [Methanocella conradii]MDI6895919.1 DUF2298 domain-containing protein [Methanocella conradii]